MRPAAIQRPPRDRRFRHRRSPLLLLIGFAALALMIAGCGSSGNGRDIAAFTNDELTTLPEQDWITNGGTLFNQRYSPLDEINRSNVAELKGVWRMHLESATAAKYSGEAQPLVHDGIATSRRARTMCSRSTSTAARRSGSTKATSTTRSTTVCCGWTSRGVAIGDGKVYLGKLDGKLVALDAEHGQRGLVCRRRRLEKGRDDHERAALLRRAGYHGFLRRRVRRPRPRQRLRREDRQAGLALLHDPRPRRARPRTWPQDNDAWKHGGAPVWQTPAVDPELGLLYFSTGNPSPDFDGSGRKGDNLFTDSIVALDAKTGEYRWHFQQVHHDIWDLDSPSPVVLFDLKIDGQLRHALAEAEQDGLGLHPRPHERQAAGRHRREARPAGAAPAHRRDATVSGGRRIHPAVDHSGGSCAAARGARRRREGGRRRGQAQHAQVELRQRGPDLHALLGPDRVSSPSPSTIGGTNWPPSSYNPETGYLYVCSAERDLDLHE